MATDSAKTTTSTAPQSVKSRYYDELFLTIAESNLVHKKVGQVNRQIPQGQGGYGTGVVYWTRWTNLPLVSAGQGEGVPTTAVSMSAANVTGSVAQYDAAVSVSDILAYTSFGDVMKEAMSRLGYNAGLSIDTVIRNAVSTAMLQVYSGGASNWTAVPSTATITIGEIRKAINRLERNDAPKKFTGGLSDMWKCIIHPDVAYDLKADTSTGGWIDANKYVNPQNTNALMKGYMGTLLGTEFFQSSNAYVRGTGVTTSASVYVTSVFGSDAFGVTNLQDLKTFVKGFGSAGSADPTDKVATAGWKTSFGVAVLNSTFGVNINTAVSSTA